MIETSLLAAWGLPQAIHLFWVVTWVALVIGLSVAFFVLLLTRKGRANPLRICIVLSLLVHALLAGYATTIQIVAASISGHDDAIDILVLVDGETEEIETVEKVAQPWENLATAVVQPEPVDLERAAISDIAVPHPAPLAELPSAPPLLTSADITVEPAQELALEASDLADTVTETLAEAIPQARQAEQLEAPNSASNEESAAVSPEVAAAERVESSQDVSEPGLPSNQPASPLLDTASLLSQLAEAPSVESHDSAVAGADDILSQSVAASPAPVEAIEASLPPVTEPEPESSGTQSTTPREIEDVPAPYRKRFESGREKIAERNGGGPEAQSAVNAGLAWLALSQSKDGRWDADRWGGGREHRIAGRDRYGAGARADTGITGLALLAFLGAGHTHQHGDYQATVTRGLSFLMRSQRSDGNLAGNAKLFARMYCHGMASFALCEAYAITGDERLLPAVQRAIDYIVAAQDKAGGGWRYQPGDKGDTSQLGWQVMALKSAELAGVRLPASTRTGIERFLRSVSSGHHGGLASYQPGRPANVAMTAEALVCRQFVGYSATNSAVSEAADYIVTKLPSSDQMNLYYYYYATLALHPLQDERWQRWNAALQKTLIETQRTSGQNAEGELTGSWDPDTAWGSHGGRAFTTAIATLSLEVYYRYATGTERPPRSAERGP